MAAALGRSGATFSLDKLTITMGTEQVFHNGEPGDAASMSAARAQVKPNDITIACDLGSGKGSAVVLTNELTPQYIQLNAEYEV